MSELTLLLLRFGFLILMWFFVFAIIYSLRADVFGAKARKVAKGDAPASVPTPAPQRPSATEITAETPPVQMAEKPQRDMPAATKGNVTNIVITSGPKVGLEIPISNETLTIGRSRESGLVIRDDYTSSHHARLVLWGEQWMLQDLDSTNGTWHNSERVASPVPIRINTPIKVGATTFELRE